MKATIKITALLLVFMSSLGFSQKKSLANLIVFNAKIHTLDEKNPIVEAIAVRDGKILKLGKNETILRLKSSKTKVIDAKGQTIIPGLFDSHSHVIRGGRFFNTELRWDGVRSLKRALQMLKEQAQRTPDGQWVRVIGGWNAYQFEEKRLPTLEEINDATGNVPAFVLHLYGHAYLNKAGLAKLKIDATTPNPSGGLIQKDEEGNPTGLLVAEPNAFILYSNIAKLPELSAEEKINSTKQFLTENNRFGITAVMDAGGGFQNYPDDYGITGKLAEQNGLTVRLPFYLYPQKTGQELNNFTKWITEVEIGNHDDHGHGDKLEYYVQGGGESLVATGADFENFDQPRPDLAPAMEEQMKAVISTLVKNKWPFRIHATYNETISRFLNVIEDVNKETPLNGLTWFFDHAETITVENLKRVKNLGGGIAIQHRMAFQGEAFIKRYGKKAAENTPPIKDMIEMGIPIGMGSDATRVSSYNPWIGLYWLTTGKTIGGTKYQGERNILDRETALKLYTQGSAKLVKLESDRGMLKENYLADFAVLSDDYFSVSSDKILDITSNLTVVNGEIVYADSIFKGLINPLPKAIPDWSPINFFGGYQKK